MPGESLSPIGGGNRCSLFPLPLSLYSGFSDAEPLVASNYRVSVLGAQWRVRDGLSVGR